MQLTYKAKEEEEEGQGGGKEAGKRQRGGINFVKGGKVRERREEGRGVKVEESRGRGDRRWR